MLDLDLAMNIATEMRIKYSTEVNYDTPYVLNTDFMLSVHQGEKIVEKARNFKLAKDLNKNSVAEKFELERRYYPGQQGTQLA